MRRSIARLDLVGSLGNINNSWGKSTPAPLLRRLLYRQIFIDENVWQSNRLFPRGLGMPFGVECYRGYASWWDKIGGTTCTAVHISMVSTASWKKGTMFEQEQPGDAPLYEEHPSCWSGKRKGSRKRLRCKKTASISPTESTYFESYFANISLDVEEPAVEAPPPLKKKRVGLEKRMSYKYPRAWKFLENCWHQNSNKVI